MHWKSNYPEKVNTRHRLRPASDMRHVPVLHGSAHARDRDPLRSFAQRLMMQNDRRRSPHRKPARAKVNPDNKNSPLLLKRRENKAGREGGGRGNPLVLDH